jgi:hypothetical protein
MQFSTRMPSRAHWCLVCLRPIEEGDRDIVVLLKSLTSQDREIVVHGDCYRADDHRSTTAPRSVHRGTSRSS